MVTLALSGRRRSRCIFVQFRVAALKAPFVSKPHPVIGTLAEEVSVFYMGAWVFVRLCGSTSTIEAGSTCHTRTALEISQETSQVGMKQEGGDRWWLTEFEFPPPKKTGASLLFTGWWCDTHPAANLCLSYRSRKIWVASLVPSLSSIPWASQIPLTLLSSKQSWMKIHIYIYIF